MKQSFSLVALAALVSLAGVQAQIPSCASNCLASAVASATSCSATDNYCQCQPANEAAIQSAATSCVVTACGATEALAVLKAAQAICASLPPTSAAAPPSTSAAAPPSSSTAPPTSYAAPPSSSVAAPVTSGSSVAAPSGSGLPITINGTVTTPPPVQFTGAASQVATGLGGFFAIAIVALAAF